MSLKPATDKRSVDDWVGEKKESTVAPAKIPTKRLTIDIPEELHRLLKTKAAAEGVKMADIVRRLIEQAV